MIIKLKEDISQIEREGIKAALEEFQLKANYKDLSGSEAFIVYSKADMQLTRRLAGMPGVAEVAPADNEYILGSRAFKEKDTAFVSDGHCIGGNAINIIAGPCSIESEEQIYAIAKYLQSVGVPFIRGGAFKPRTSPYSFQGLGRDGLVMIKEAARTYGLQVVTEIIDSSLIDEIYPYADILQVGSRNMQNYFFLKQLGRTDKPILLKRGMYSRIDEWLMAAEYILSEGNEKVILCERGIRTFDNAVRNTMDIAAISLVKQLSHLPVFADPSHGTGQRNLITPLSLASIAAGADGLMVEIHPDPTKALSDGMQSLYLDQFSDLLNKAAPVANAIGRSLNINTSDSKQIKTDKLCVE